VPLSLPVLASNLVALYRTLLANIETGTPVINSKSH